MTSYQLRLKIYTNPNLPIGGVVVPFDAISGQLSNLLHCHPDDYLKILGIIAEYFRNQGKEESNGEEQEEDS